MLKYFLLSILLNLFIMYLFYIFVAQPIKVISQAMAKSWCESLKIDCEFKK